MNVEILICNDCKKIIGANIIPQKEEDERIINEECICLDCYQSYCKNREDE